MARRWQCRGRWPFINIVPALARSLGADNTTIWCPLCPPDTVEYQSSIRTSVRGPDHVITDWQISDHMQSSKQDVTCDIIAYYVCNL
ncbi:unnamed protein product [Staurois parvus]|uniref:Uncharacterized protein n=1 Tax=Staurois parvus TaxID=386267 RepID=A0ABN9DX99_9NEOB|nr:unnamed protein product [Staurois parvus]